MRVKLLAALVTTVAATVGAQDLSLHEAVATALTNNPEVTSARERAEAAAARLDGGRQRRMPRIGLSESYIYSNNPAEVFALSLNQGRFDLQEFFLSDPNDPEPLSTWSTRLDLELPLYTGGKLAARIDQAESMVTAEEHSLAHTRSAVAFDTISAYIDLAKAREQVAVLDKARSTTAEHVRIAEQYAAQGMVLDAEVLRARVHLSEVEEQLARARNGARLAEAALNFVLGARQATPRTLAPLPAAPAVGAELEDLTAAAADERRDLQAARLKLAAGELEAKAARPGYFPEVAVVGHYDLYDDRIFGSNGHSGTVMAVAKIDLWGGGAGNAERTAARHEAAAFAADVERFEEGVELEVRQAWQDLDTARTRHTTAAASLTAAEEALRVRESRFKQGLDRMIDLLDAETALREADMRELVARYDIAQLSYRLRFVTGARLLDSMEESR